MHVKIINLSPTMSNNQEVIRRSLALKRTASALNGKEEELPESKKQKIEAPRGLIQRMIQLDREVLQKRSIKYLDHLSDNHSSIFSILPITRAKVANDHLLATDGLMVLNERKSSLDKLLNPTKFYIEPETYQYKNLTIRRDSSLRFWLNGDQISPVSYQKLKNFFRCADVKSLEEALPTVTTVYLGRTIVTDGVNHTVGGKKVTASNIQYLRKLIAEGDENEFVRVYDFIKDHF